MSEIKQGTKVTIPALGDACGVVDVLSPGDGGGIAHVDLGAAGDWRGPLVMLKAVVPPLPPEPADKSYVMVQHRIDPDAYPVPVLALFRRRGQYWYRDGLGEGKPWAEVVEMDEDRAPVTLVPDLAAEAPPLPWMVETFREDVRDLFVDRARGDGSVLEINDVGLAQNDIRRLMAICARHLKPGAERDALMAAAEVSR